MPYGLAMTPNDPLDANDGWADLARELGLEGDRGMNPAPPSLSASLPPDMEAESPESDQPPADQFDLEGDGFAEVAEVSETDEALEGDDGDSDEDDNDSAGDSGGEEGEEPGTKKRRRRRRRRKKKGATEAGEDPPATAVATEDERVVVQDDSASDEGLSPEMTRELIRTWNVPSWEEIVTGLYRPPDR